MDERLLTITACFAVAALLGLLGGIFIAIGQHPYAAGGPMIGLALLLAVLGFYFASGQPAGRK